MYRKCNLQGFVWGRGILNCLEASVLRFLELRLITRTEVVLGTLGCLRACVLPFEWNRETKLAQCVVKYENSCLLPCLPHWCREPSIFSSRCCGRQNSAGGVTGRIVDGCNTNRLFCVLSFNSAVSKTGDTDGGRDDSDGRLRIGGGPAVFHAVADEETTRQT